MEMLFSKRNKLIACGVIAMALALATLSMDYYRRENCLSVVRALQVTATVALFFGILKKKTLHKDKFLLFWMAMTTILFIALIMCSSEYFIRFEEYLLTVLVMWTATALVAYLLYYVYQEYEELTESSSVAAAPETHEINAVFETKEQPPPYVVPTTDNSVLSV